MRHFHLLRAGIETAPLANAIVRNPQLWNEHTLRTQHAGTAHSDVDDIWLRFNDVEAHKVGASSDSTQSRGVGACSILDDHESINYPAMSALPAARGLIFDLMRMVVGERLGRVIVTRLPAGKSIEPHVDGGDHAAYYDRYLFVLQCPIGCSFRVGAETVQMQVGDLWWFDNGIEHEVVNLGADDRIVMIVDIRTFR